MAVGVVLSQDEGRGEGWAGVEWWFRSVVRIESRPSLGHAPAVTSTVDAFDAVVDDVGWEADDATAA